MHGYHLSRKEVEVWKASVPNVDRAIEEARARDWEGAPNALLSEAVKRLEERVVRFSNASSTDGITDHGPCCESSAPFYIAMRLRFPESYVCAMNFGVRRLSESHWERVKFVLRYADRNPELTKFNPDTNAVMLRHYGPGILLTDCGLALSMDS